MIRTLVSLVGLAAALQAAAAEDLDGFTLKAWNKMTCRPQSLHAGDRFRITVPKGRNDEMEVFTPSNEFIELVQPPPAQGYLYTSAQLKPGKTLVVDTSRLYGLGSVEREHVFVQPGRYIFMIGNHFGTEKPNVNGWCRVTFHGPLLMK